MQSRLPYLVPSPMSSAASNAVDAAVATTPNRLDRRGPVEVSFDAGKCALRISSAVEDVDVHLFPSQQLAASLRSACDQMDAWLSVVASTSGDAGDSSSSQQQLFGVYRDTTEFKYAWFWSMELERADEMYTQLLATIDSGERGSLEDVHLEVWTRREIDMFMLLKDNCVKEITEIPLDIPEAVASPGYWPSFYW